MNFINGYNENKIELNVFLKTIILIIIIFFIKFGNKKEYNNKVIFNKELEKFTKSLSNITESEINNFRELNSKNILIDTLKYRRNKNPEISVILTIYNQAHCFHKALRSIQNQSLKNIEIIISVDCSLDNSTEVINIYKKEDERIIFISHDKSIGTMKNRNDGIKISKGKYITILDGDDAFLHNNVLKNVLYVANIGNLDIVEFPGYIYKEQKINKEFHFHKINGIIKQPELKTYFYNIKEKVNLFPLECPNIVSKLIKNNILKKVIKFIGRKYSEDYIVNYEDQIVTVSLYIIAKSYFFFQQVGYYYSKDEKKEIFPFLTYKKCNKRIDKDIELYNSILKFFNFLNEKLENNLKEIQILYETFIRLNRLKRLEKLNDYVYVFLGVINRLDNTKYISKDQKQNISIIKIKLLKEKK